MTTKTILFYQAVLVAISLNNSLYNYMFEKRNWGKEHKHYKNKGLPQNQ
jgi:hypothetical protein